MEGVIGYTTLFAGNFEPKNWAFCQGQTIAISSNTALFSILGTTYGGNGTTTFMLPDLRGRKVVGAGNGPGLSPYALGQVGGSETATLTMDQMPAHIHQLQVTSVLKSLEDNGNTSVPEGAIFAGSTGGYASSGAANMKSYNVAVTMTSSGSDSPYEILPPYLTMNYVICMYGIFPPRG